MIMATNLFLSLNFRPPIISFPSTPTNYHLTLTTFPHLRTQTHNSFPKNTPRLVINYNNTPPETECPVPWDQQPINEYQALSSSFPFSWASGDIVEYCSRLFVTGACFAIFVGLPVSWFGSVGPKSEPIRLVLAAASSGLFVVILAAVRMYLGWAYVGNRLLSATVEYEETGWYDGQIWVKTAEVLARDRLLGSFSVKPVLSRLKNTLIFLGTSLLICIVLFINSESSPQKDVYVDDIGSRAIPRFYNDDSARNFEPDAFCGESNVS